MPTEPFNREVYQLFFDLVRLYQTAFPTLSFDQILQHIAQGHGTLHRGFDRIDDRRRALRKRQRRE